MEIERVSLKNLIGDEQVDIQKAEEKPEHCYVSFHLNPSLAVEFYVTATKAIGGIMTFPVEEQRKLVTGIAAKLKRDGDTILFTEDVHTRDTAFISRVSCNNGVMHLLATR